VAWEQRPIDVVVGLPHQGTTSMEWCVAFAQLYAHLSQTRKFYLTYNRGSPIDIARNKIVEDTLKLGAEWLFFLDSDVIVPANIVDILVSRSLPVVSALYVRRHKNIYPGMWKLMPVKECPECKQPVTPHGKYAPIINYPRGALVEADVVGMGCILINRKVLEAVHKPPQNPMFVWTMGRVEPESAGVSEDFYACERIRDAGYHIVVDTSIICPHYGEAKFVPKELMNIDEVKYGGITFPEV